MILTAVSDLAGLVSNLEYSNLSPETVDRVKAHILDSYGAMLSGGNSHEGKALKNLFSDLAPVSKTKRQGLPLSSSIATHCAAARCTEFDDIHLESCITPGSIVVPTAISLVEKGYLTDPGEFIVTVLAGYEVMIRFGLAINGPAVLQKGIWPTYFAAAPGSAAVTARALKLDRIQTVNALSTAFALSSGTVMHPRGELTSRWLTVGLAAQNGSIAAFAVKKGFTGNDTIAAETTGQFFGLPFEASRLNQGLNRRFMIDETGLKPYPVARQGLPAVEVFREIINQNKIQPESIENIIVYVPQQVTGVIDRPTPTGNRLDSISSVQYQIALACIKPEALSDLEREQFYQTDEILSLIKKVKVVGDIELGKLFPATWPARLEVAASGQTLTMEMLYPPGDHRNPLGWDALRKKFYRAACTVLKPAVINKIAEFIQNLDNNSDLTGLSSSLDVNTDEN